MARSQWRGTVDDSGLREEAASPTAESVYTEKKKRFTCVERKSLRQDVDTLKIMFKL